MEAIVPPFEILPAELRPGVETLWSRFVDNAERAEIDLTSVASRSEDLLRVWAASEFVGQACAREPALIGRWISQGILDEPRATGSIAGDLATQLIDVENEQTLGDLLRRFRRREMARIAWRDLNGDADIDETLRDLSDLAEACIDQAVICIDRWQREEWGVPKGPEGEETSFVVFGMGKLGGGELNFSSDIDLIFAYGADGEVDGPRDKSNREYYERLGRRVIKALDALTGEGFVYRVDMRLRPYGQSGPLVASFDALEDYYTTTGRDWERYAMIKARPVGGDRTLGEEILSMLRPFVYRRYLDFGAFESLREMKAMIEAEMSRRDMGDHIKLGPGGIREIEFMGQVFQLLRGGREPSLRQRGIVSVLRALAQLKLLPEDLVEQLIAAYGVLRRCENRLQAVADQQTHVLPTDDVGRTRLAFSMGFADWGSFMAMLDELRGTVHQAFNATLAPEGGKEDDAQADVAVIVWRGGRGEDVEQQAMAELGFGDVDASLSRLAAFRDGPIVRALSEQGRQRLDRLMPLMLDGLRGCQEIDECFQRLLAILESIARRTVYLALLCESPQALKQLIKLVAASPWVAEQIGKHPLLLDELLDQRTLLALGSRDELAAELDRRLAAVEPGDMEQEMEALRQFKHANVLRTAAAEISGVRPLMKVSDTLTEVAEVILERSSALGARDLQQRWGAPHFRADGVDHEAGFAVVGYGKLGGLELGHKSDLDLVFLHDSHGEAQMTDGDRATDNAVYFARLGQRIMHYLNTMTPSGMAYEVDMRLRPSGNSGLLVSSLESFAAYQREKAWTWEHQALVRARYVVGPGHIRQQFDAIRHEILSRPRDEGTLQEEVRDMRRRMIDELGSKDGQSFHLKHDPGGIVDIEFMVQYGVLAWSASQPALTRWSDNVRILEDFATHGLMSEEETELLTQAYLAYRSRNHELALLGRKGRVTDGEFSGYQKAVRDIWDRVLGKA